MDDNDLLKLGGLACRWHALCKERKLVLQLIEEYRAQRRQLTNIKFILDVKKRDEKYRKGRPRIAAVR